MRSQPHQVRSAPPIFSYPGFPDFQCTASRPFRFGHNASGEAIHFCSRRWAHFAANNPAVVKPSKVPLMAIGNRTHTFRSAIQRTSPRHFSNLGRVPARYERSRRGLSLPVHSLSTRVLAMRSRNATRRCVPLSWRPRFPWITNGRDTFGIACRLDCRESPFARRIVTCRPAHTPLRLAGRWL